MVYALWCGKKKLSALCFKRELTTRLVLQRRAKNKDISKIQKKKWREENCNSNKIHLYCNVFLCFVYFSFDILHRRYVYTNLVNKISVNTTIVIFISILFEFFCLYLRYWLCNVEHKNENIFSWISLLALVTMFQDIMHIELSTTRFEFYLRNIFS